MRHRIAGRKLGRTSEHRLALLRNLSTALFEREKIKTTLAKAKELRPFAERLVTLSKRETLHARRQVLRHIHDKSVVAKLFDTLSARYAERPGGYTRILKVGARRGDNAEMAIIELVDAESAAEATEAEPKAKKRASRKPKGDADGAAAKKKKSSRKDTAQSAKPRKQAAPRQTSSPRKVGD